MRPSQPGSDPRLAAQPWHLLAIALVAAALLFTLAAWTGAHDSAGARHHLAGSPGDGDGGSDPDGGVAEWGGDPRLGG